ncbi:hypothetical protein GCM10023196_041110 [Actinoallomurus vinaceus]|uniref:Uncharacterized protein n=1 Tax=Actinoallomurus vinaceus TaxID=1080074 RepID=A0ABP8UAL2_9ACTN
MTINDRGAAAAAIVEATAASGYLDDLMAGHVQSSKDLVFCTRTGTALGAIAMNEIFPADSGP